MDGTRDKVWIVPAKPKDETRGFLMLGIDQPDELQGVDPQVAKDIEDSTVVLDAKEPLTIRPGELRYRHRLRPARDQPSDFYPLDDALQKSDGHPVELTLVDESGHQRSVQLHPAFDEPFSKDPLNFAGMLPRTVVASVMKDSPAEKAGFAPGDVIFGNRFHQTGRGSAGEIGRARR